MKQQNMEYINITYTTNYNRKHTNTQITDHRYIEGVWKIEVEGRESREFPHPQPLSRLLSF